MIQYLKFRGDLSFRQSPFCDIDAMILSQLSSVDYTGLVPGAEDVYQLSQSKKEAKPTIAQVAEWMTEDKPGYAETKPNVILLLKLAGASKRFGNIRMDGFIRDTDTAAVKQFSAVTFDLNWRTRFVAFRGTDGYVVSWKENLNMNYMYPVPSQCDAVEYLRRMQPRLCGKPMPAFLAKLMIGGHSKGGNLAVYASSHVEEKLQKKMQKIYAFDSPGYRVDISEEPGFLRIKDLITGYIPGSSAVGRMMLVPYESTVIKSTASGVSQHSMFSWTVEGTRLLPVEGTDAFSQEITDVTNRWRESIPVEEMKGHVDGLFDIFAQNGIVHADQLKHMDARHVLRILLGARGMAQEDKQFFMSVVRILWGVERKKIL